jgi:hypothetical protein
VSQSLSGRRAPQTSPRFAPRAAGVSGGPRDRLPVVGKAFQSLRNPPASALATAVRRAALSSVSIHASYTLWNVFAGVNRCSAVTRRSGPPLAWTSLTIAAPVAGKSVGCRKLEMTAAFETDLASVTFFMVVTTFQTCDMTGDRRPATTERRGWAAALIRPRRRRPLVTPLAAVGTAP